MSKRRTSKHELAISEAWKSFYATPEGRQALADLMVWCNVYTPIDSVDPIELAVAEGERRVALRLAQLIGLRPDHFPTQAWDDTDLLDRMMNQQTRN